MLKSLIVLFAVLLAVSCAPITPPAPAVAPTAAPTVAPAAAATDAPAAPTLTGKMRFAMTGVLNTHSIPMLMALEALQAQGVQVETTALANSSLAAAALTGGDADIAALNNQTMWAAIGKGAQTRTIMQRYFTAPIIYTKSELKTCADLDGKSLGFANTTGVTPSLFADYLDDNCPGTEPQLLQIDSEAMLPALQSGTIDGGNLSVEQILEADRTDPGKYHILVDLGKVYPNIQSSGIHVDKAWAEANPKVVNAFIRNLIAVHRQINENPQLLIDQAVKRLEVSEDIAKKTVELELDDNTWDQNGGMTVDKVQYTLDFLADIEALPTRMTAEQVTDLSYLEAVLDEMGRIQ